MGRKIANFGQDLVDKPLKLARKASGKDLDVKPILAKKTKESAAGQLGVSSQFGRKSSAKALGRRFGDSAGKTRFNYPLDKPNFF